MPDALLPSDFIRLQSPLDEQISSTISSIINSTVAEYIDLSLNERNNLIYWNDTQASYIQAGVIINIDTGEANMGIWAGQGTNWSQIFLARWVTIVDQTFQSQAERYSVTRRTYTATWNITSLNINLVRLTAFYIEELSSVFLRASSQRKRSCYRFNSGRTSHCKPSSIDHRDQLSVALCTHLLAL